MNSNNAQANSAQTLLKAVADCMMRDRFRLTKRIHGAQKIKKNEARAAVFDEIALDIAQSMAQAEARANHRATINYPEILPVSQKKKDIAKAIENHQVVIIAGETGSGKRPRFQKSVWNWGVENLVISAIRSHVVWRLVRSRLVLLKRHKPS